GTNDGANALATGEKLLGDVAAQQTRRPGDHVPPTAHTVLPSLASGEIVATRMEGVPGSPKRNRGVFFLPRLRFGLSTLRWPPPSRTGGPAARRAAVASVPSLA